MKSKKIYGTVFTVMLLISFSACGGDDSPSAAGGCNGFLWTQEISDEAVALSEAGGAYGSDPTVAKCEVYKDAYRDYIDALEDVDFSCIAEANEQDYQEALAEARAEIDAFECSDPN